MIEFINVTKMFKDKCALNNVNIKIDKGEFVYLIGHSGAGKSTFFNLLLKIFEPDSGKIIFNDYLVNNLPNRLIPAHRRRMGIVYQNFSLLPKKTIAENIEFSMRIIGEPKSKIRKRIPQILTLVGLKEKIDNYPDELSIGEQQRVAIARAIVNNPKVLIADEPTGNLDPITGWEIMTLLEQINNRGTTVVMITHSQDIVNSMPKRVIALSKGEVISDAKGKYKVGDLTNIPIEVSDEIKNKSEVYNQSTGNLENIKILNDQAADSDSNKKTEENNDRDKEKDTIQKPLSKKTRNLSNNKTTKIKNPNKNDENPKQSKNVNDKRQEPKPLSSDEEINLKLKKSKVALNKKLKKLEETAGMPQIDFDNMEDFLGVSNNNINNKNEKLKNNPNQNNYPNDTSNKNRTNQSQYQNTPINNPNERPVNQSKKEAGGINNNDKKDIKNLNSKTIEELQKNELSNNIENAKDIDPFDVDDLFNEKNNKKINDDTLTIFSDYDDELTKKK